MQNIVSSTFKITIAYNSDIQKPKAPSQSNIFPGSPLKLKQHKIKKSYMGLEM